MSEAPTTRSVERTFRLTYRSRSLIGRDERKAVLGELFSQARRNNKAREITGALLVTDDWFVQTLEGEEDGVRELYARIESDPRHDSFSLLTARPVGERVFGRWSMAEVASVPGESDTFLLAHHDGIAPAANLRPTSEQESVLGMMRTAARGGFPEEPDDLEPPAVGSDEPRRSGVRTGPLAM